MVKSLASYEGIDKILIWIIKRGLSKWRPDGWDRSEGRERGRERERERDREREREGKGEREGNREREKWLVRNFLDLISARLGAGNPIENLWRPDHTRCTPVGNSFALKRVMSIKLVEGKLGYSSPVSYKFMQFFHESQLKQILIPSNLIS